MSRIKIIFILLLAASSAQAQLDSNLRKIELPASVITKGNPLEETKIKASEVVLTKKNIQKLNTAVDLPFVINQTPSTVVGSDAGTGTGYTNLRIRGTDITRINVNMNGIPVNDAEGQGTFFVNFSDILGSANSLSVERGIGTSKVGYGNFGGAVSINNLDIDYEKPFVSFMTDFGSFNTLKTSLKGSTGLLNDKFITTVRLSRIVSDGFIDRSFSQLRSAQITSKYKLNEKSSLTFNYVGGKERTGQAWNGVGEIYDATNKKFLQTIDTLRQFNELGPKGDGTFYDNQTDNYQQDYYQLFYDRVEKNVFKDQDVLRLGGALYLTKGKGYYEEYKLGEKYSDYGLSNFIQGNDTTTRTDLIRQLWLDNDFYGFRAYANYFSRKVQLGLYLNSSQYKGDHFGEVIWAQKGISNDYRWYDLDATKNDNNAYAMFSYQLLKNLQVFADVQVRNVQYQINGFRKNPTIERDLAWNFVNPKVELRYSPDKKTLLSLFVAKSSKEPNRDDFEIGLDKIPEAESMVDIELNAKRKIGKNLNLYATLYHMDYQNQLVLDGAINDVGAYSRVNVDKSFRQGLELLANYTWNKNLILQANVSFANHRIQSYNERIDNFDNGTVIENNFSNTRIAFSPNIIAGGQLTFYPLRGGIANNFSELSIDLMPKYVGRQYLDNTENIIKSIDPYTTVDLLVNMPYKLKKGGTLKLRGGIMNLLNTQYESNGYTFSFISGGRQEVYNYFYPMAGIRYTIGLGIEF